MLGNPDRTLREEKVLEFWKERKIFEKTLCKESPKGEFVFYEGPPTANGLPAIHHLEARAFKDAIPRYKTMRGFRVSRKAGWDTHGLPVELEVEKILGLKSKKAIEDYGIAKFNRACRENVQKYISEWSKFTDRIGYWVDLSRAYFTYDTSYIEAVWSILAHADKRSLLYKDYKVVPWCPRCGTALSSHELAQGYKEVKDLSLYVKFKVKGEEKTYFLAWTTTPWTLPGNVALAVGEKFDYVKIKTGDEFLILAKERLSVVAKPYEIIEKYKGRDLVGLQYEPLFPFVPEGESAFRVYPARFVTTDDGTGIVHTAVMYGQDDFDLGTEVGLPKQHLVSPEGVFVPNTGFLAGRSVIDESLSVDILKDLEKRGLLFGKEKHLHTYPFCWRCKTRLIYYARDSWYLKMSALRDRLVEENKKINWEPAYIKEGRFGEWLREVKDWALSRERYWGTPLPIWQNKSGEKRIVVDSLETLRKYAKGSKNSYFVMRHGATRGNAAGLISYKEESKDHLTEDGKKQVEKALNDLREKKIDTIISSPFARTRETAELVAGTLGIKLKDIVFDQRIGELNPGECDGRPWAEYHVRMSERKGDWFTYRLKGGESLAECRFRVGEFLYETESRYKDKNILFITHGLPAWFFYVNAGLFLPEGESYSTEDDDISPSLFKRFANGEVRPLPFTPLPHDENFEIDLHRPFIDEIVLVKNGEEYHRVSEVLDVWFDSGAMPFAQDPRNVLYPADFISEAIDQTRGWFYTLHAIGNLMEKGIAYKNVICLGHLLDKEGKKMSKSIGNVVDPWEEIRRHGVDALRFWMYSVNQPGESKNFDTDTVAEIGRKVFNVIDNVLAFYELYRDRGLEGNKRPEEGNILDSWIMARLDELAVLSTTRLDQYNLLEPTRAVRAFLDDLSTWYVRRSRERIKDGDVMAKKTLYFVLKTLAKLIAPFAPFAAEELYQKLRSDNDPESVHLEGWPEGKEFDKKLLSEMAEARRISSLALEARSQANIKVRQPLGKLEIKSSKLEASFLELIKEEVNVKEIAEDPKLGKEVELDTSLTPELVEEGRLRDLIRAIQDERKEKGLKPGEPMAYEVLEEDRELLAKHGEEIKRITSIEF